MTAWPLAAANVGTGLPLEGVRVLDLSRVLAGPLAAMVAGDLGADVIKVEGPGGDPVRALSPPRFGEDATYYLAINRHRRNVVADLRDPAGFATVEALVREADAVVENYLPSQAGALGVGRLRSANPDCVWVSVTSATSGGPLADRPSFDLLAQARSGLMGVTGEPGGDPAKVGAPVADVVTGLYAAIALLTGLYARAAGAPGRNFEAPLLECAMSALVNQAQGYLSTGVASERTGNDHPSIAPYGSFRTGDGLLMIAVGTDGQFAKLVAALGDERIAARVDWAPNAARVAALGELRAELERALASASAQAWAERLGAAGVPVGPVLDVPGAFAQDQIVAGDFVGEMDAPSGPTRAMRTPLLIDGARPPIRSGPRRLGEDTGRLG
ncbi:MAG TPA: CoA transferase [Acidimicrobiales bacterium]|nr:CoA transferase [Acidimicrobiales bacterium]